MTADDLLRRRLAPLRLVIFDCDGVLVDSEPVSNRVLAEDLSARGWAMTGEEAEHLFLGTSIEAIQRHAESRLAQPLPADWRALIKTAITAAMRREAVPVPGAVEALDSLDRLGIAWRVASNSSHEEMAAKFGRLGLTGRMAGRVHSFQDVPHGKPAPDIYLAAAAAGGAEPAECLVVEDSVPGVTAAVAAGIDCLGLDRSADGRYLRAAGAVPIHAMDELPRLFGLATRRAAA